MYALTQNCQENLATGTRAWIRPWDWGWAFGNYRIGLAIGSPQKRMPRMLDNYNQVEEILTSNVPGK
jgi:hypothetical protein